MVGVTTAPTTKWILLALLVSVTWAPRTWARMLFAPANPVPVDKRPRFMTVQDIDLDGVDDVLLVSTRGTLTVLYGSSASPTLFTAPRVSTFGKRLRRPALGDVDGDGVTDIAIADESGGGIWVLLGTGARRFAPPRFVPVDGFRPYTVAIADIDGRGGGDLVVGERRSGRVRLRLNSAEFSFRDGSLLVARDGAERLECSDLNGDLLPEVIVISTGHRGRISVFAASESRSGTAEYSNAVVFATQSNDASLTIADFDGNGTRDLATLERPRGARNSRVVVRTGNSDTTFTSSMSVDAECIGYRRGRACRARGIAAADFDGDGVVDIAIGLRGQSSIGALQTRRAGVVSILRGRGDTFIAGALAPWLEKTPTALGAGDFNGDGLPDIVSISRSRSSLQAMLNLSSPD